MAVLINDLDHKFKLYKDLHSTIIYNDHKFDVTVFAGFGTDLASIPWYFEPFFDDNDPKTADPAIVHDYLRRSAYFPHFLTDRLFYTNLKQNKFKYAYMYYKAVQFNAQIYRAKFPEFIDVRKQGNVVVTRL